MSSNRFFSGARSGGPNSGGLRNTTGFERLNEIKNRQKRKQMSPSDRYRAIMQDKLDEHKKRAMNPSRNQFGLPGTYSKEKELSQKAQQMIQQMAQRDAIKEARKRSQRVIIRPQNFGQTGFIDRKGRVYDRQNQEVMRVNIKNGKIQTRMGMTLGKYNPKASGFRGRMEGWIKQNSPYYQSLNKAMQQYGVHGTQALDIHGAPIGGASNSPYGNANDAKKVRDNAGITGWGVRSNNVWGGFAENTWGGFAENVWGGADSNIWGGLGDAGNFMSGTAPLRQTPGRKIWGSAKGKQKNHLKIALKKMFAGLSRTRSSSRTRF